MTETTLTLRIFAGFQVAGTRFVVTELASTRLLEPFGGTLSCFHFRHCYIPLC